MPESRKIIPPHLPLSPPFLQKARKVRAIALPDAKIGSLYVFTASTKGKDL